MRLDDGVVEQQRRWSVIIPVKHLAHAKTRLAATQASDVEDLALAFFEDTATAVLSSPSVGELVVATSEPRAAQWTREHGGRVVDDSGQLGINAAAAAAGATGRPHLAVMVSDLPCATPTAIEVALAACPRSATAIVPDAEGTGTTMWLGVPARLADLRFGPQSRSLHLATGAIDLIDLVDDVVQLAPIRRDVDTERDLADAVNVGVGLSTTRALDRRKQPSANRPA